MVISPEHLYLFNVLWLLYVPMSVQSVLRNPSNALRVENLVGKNKMSMGRRVLSSELLYCSGN